MMRWFVLGCIALAGAGYFAYDYFTQPERVFGSNELECPPHEIRWRASGSVTSISGCGESVEAVCGEEECRYPDEEANLLH